MAVAVKNFVKASQDWFDVDLTEFNFYLMPLAFLSPSKNVVGVTLNREERNLASFIANLDTSNDGDGYAVSVNVEIKFSRSKAIDALNIQLTNNPSAPKLQLTEEQLKDRYPLNYAMLTDECRQRYSDFMINQKYHDLRMPLKQDKKFCLIRKLDPDNPKSAKQDWFSRAILTEFDKHYQKRT